MRRSWVESFSFEFGNLFPEPESEKLQKNSMYLDNLLKVKQLGGLTSDIQAELNESKIFTNDIELDETQTQDIGMESSFYSRGFEKSGFNNPPQVDGIGGLKVDDAEFEEEHPRDEDGKFVKGNGETKKEKESNNKDLSEEEKQNNEKEIQEKIDKLKSIDWEKDNTLPNLNKDTLEQFDLEDKTVLLKKNIIEKNKLNHPDITNEKAIRIIGNALYKPETVLKANPDKPAYHNFITRTDDEHSDIVLLELSDKKENYEIVNYHIISNRQREQKENMDKNIK